MESVSASSVLLIKTLTEGVKPMNIENKEIEYQRRDSILLA